MSKPILKVESLSRTYATANGPLAVLTDVDLEIRPGEVVGLLGPSGSGKSSLLHSVGLLERPTAGVILIDGVAVESLPERARTRLRRRSIGFVYQFHHLIAELNALDNVALPLRMEGCGRPEARRRAAELLAALGLSDRLLHQPGQLSGGEQQRVAVARALSNRPRLLLADEPTGNLDPATSLTVFTTLCDRVRAKGVGALIATHNVELARRMDRVFRLRGGMLEAQALSDV